MLDINLTDTLILDTKQTVKGLSVRSAPSVAIAVRAKVNMKRISINGCGLAGIILEDGSDGSTFEDITINDYNKNNQNGQAGFFVYTKNVIKDITIKNVRTSYGNGNGIRLSNVNGAEILGCLVLGTFGQSSEGIGINNSEDITVKHSACKEIATSGSIVWGNCSDISYYDNYFKDISVNNPAGSHPAITVNPNGGVVDGLVIDGNRVSNAQRMLLVDGIGSLSGRYGINYQWKCLNKDQVAFGVKSQIQQVDWICI